MAWVDWPLALVALAPAPVVSFAVIVFGRAIHTRFERIQEMFSDISSRVQENLAGVRMIRAYVQEKRRDASVSRNSTANTSRENIRLVRTQGMFMPLLQALIGLAFLVVLWAGAPVCCRGSISLGSFVMFNTYMGMLVWPMIALGWVVNLMQRGTASLARIDEMMQQKPTHRRARAAEALAPRARRDRVSRRVAWHSAIRISLDGVNLRIPAGSTVAIVGHTGAGKSTLVSLIPRIIDPTSGTVLVDGHDVREYSSGSTCGGRSGSFRRRRFCSALTLGENIALRCQRGDRRADPARGGNGGACHRYRDLSRTD